MDAAQGVGLVGQPHEERVSVGVGVDRHAADAGVLARADDPHGDLASVGDQDLLQSAGLGHPNTPGLSGPWSRAGAARMGLLPPAAYRSTGARPATARAAGCSHGPTW